MWFTGGGRFSAAFHVGVEPARNARAPAGDQDGELPGACQGPCRGQDRAGDRRITLSKCDSVLVINPMSFLLCARQRSAGGIASRLMTRAGLTLGVGELGFFDRFVLEFG